MGLTYKTTPSDVVFDNPEIMRYLRAGLRPTKAIGIAIAYILILTSIGLVILLAHWGLNAITGAELRESMKLFYTILISIEFLVFLGGGAITISHLIAQERERSTYDLYYLTTYNRKAAIFGRLLGGAAIPYLLVQLTLPFVALSLLSGDIPVVSVIKMHVLLLASGLFIHVFALFVSTFNVKGNTSQGIVIVCLILFSSLSSSLAGISKTAILGVMSPVIHLISGFAQIWRDVPSTGYAQTVNFFGVNVPGLLMAMMLYAYFGFWMLLAIVRRLEHQFLSLFSRAQTLLFVLSFEILLAGGLWPTTKVDADAATLIYFVLNLILCTALSFDMTPRYAKVLSQLEAKARGEKKSSALSPSSFFLLLLGITLFVHFIIQGLEVRFDDLWKIDFALRSFCLVIYGCLYFGVVRFCRLFPGKGLDLVALAVIILSLALPFPAAGVMGWEKSLHYVFVLNPFGLATHLFGEKEWCDLGNIGLLLNIAAPLLAVVMMAFLFMARRGALAVRMTSDAKPGANLQQ